MKKIKTNILITLVKGKVYCEINGNREELIDALATLLTDPEKERDSFKNLIKEAMDILALENMESFRQEQKLLNHTTKDDLLSN